MEHDIQKSLELYKEQLRYGYIRTAYLTLTKYVAELKAKFPTQYKTGNISFGYLDQALFENWRNAGFGQILLPGKAI